MLPVPTEPEEIPPLTDGWQKARKSYGLFAGLLMAWELVGFDVAEVPLDNVNLKLLTPSAIPWVLLAMLAYFAVRASIEWHQCSARRRRTIPAKVDWNLSHALALLAVAIFVVQRVLQAQLASYLPESYALRNAEAAFFPSIVAMVFVGAGFTLSDWKKGALEWSHLWWMTFLLANPAFILWSIMASPLPATSGMWASFACGVPLAWFNMVSARKLRALGLFSETDRRPSAPPRTA